jgi:hypothetical protein
MVNIKAGMPKNSMGRAQIALTRVNLQTTLKIAQMPPAKVNTKRKKISRGALNSNKYSQAEPSPFSIPIIIMLLIAVKTITRSHTSELQIVRIPAITGLRVFTPQAPYGNIQGCNWFLYPK